MISIFACSSRGFYVIVSNEIQSAKERMKTRDIASFLVSFLFLSGLFPLVYPRHHLSSASVPKVAGIQKKIRKSEQQREYTIDDIDDYVLGTHILPRLGFKDAQSILLTSKRFNRVFQEDESILPKMITNDEDQVSDIWIQAVARDHEFLVKSYLTHLVNKSINIDASSLIWSVMHNSTSSFHLILPAVDPTEQEGASLLLSIANGTLLMTQTLASDPRFLNLPEQNIINFWRALVKAPNSVESARILIEHGFNPQISSGAPIHLAVIRNRVDLLEYFVNEIGIDPSFQSNSLVKFASVFGQVDALRFLLSDTRVDPSAGNNAPLILALRHQNADVVLELIKDPRVDFDPDTIAKFATELGRLDILRFVWQRVDDPQVLLLKAITFRQSHIVEFLLEDIRVDPAFNNNTPLQTVCQIGDLEIFDILIHADINPIYPSNLPFLIAVQYGHLHIVHRFSQLPGYAPHFPENQALSIAARYGHLNIADFLLQDTRVDPRVGNSKAVREALETNQSMLLYRLLSDARVDPAFDNNFLLRRAAVLGHAEALMALLRDERVDPTVDNNFPARMALERKHDFLLTVLMADPRFDPTFDDNIIFRRAITENRGYLISNLLWNDRVDPTFSDNWALKTVLQSRKMGMLRVFLDSPKINPAFDDNYMLRKACRLGHLFVVHLLLTHPRVDPSVDEQRLFIEAILSDNEQIVKAFMNHPNIDVSFDNFRAVRGAVRLNKPNSLRALLQNPRVDPTFDSNYLMNNAIEEERWDAAYVLFQDERVRSMLSEEAVQTLVEFFQTQ